MLSLNCQTRQYVAGSEEVKKLSCTRDHDWGPGHPPTDFRRRNRWIFTMKWRKIEDNYTSPSSPIRDGSSRPLRGDGCRFPDRPCGSQTF